MNPVAAKPALHALASLVGVQTRYEDVFFKTHDASNATIAAILTALGFDVTTDEHIERALNDYETRALERGLEPVYVFASGSRIEVALVIPQKRPIATRSWTLVAEDGSRLRHKFDPTQLHRNAIVAATGLVYERMVLPLAEKLADGYYDLVVHDEAATYTSRLIVARARAICRKR